MTALDLDEGFEGAVGFEPCAKDRGPLARTALNRSSVCTSPGIDRLVAQANRVFSVRMELDQPSGRISRSARIGPTHAYRGERCGQRGAQRRRPSVGLSGSLALLTAPLRHPRPCVRHKGDDTGFSTLIRRSRWHLNGRNCVRSANRDALARAPLPPRLGRQRKRECRQTLQAYLSERHGSVVLGRHSATDHAGSRNSRSSAAGSSGHLSGSRP